MAGVLVVDKPLGITSHDVVNRARRALGTKRVGHAGTLDPLATGVLVLAIDAATRYLQYFDLEPKEYLYTAKFGETTLTQDAEGEVVESRPVPTDLEARIDEHLPHGEIEQIPPMYSAVKKAGQPLYAYARRGEEVEREPRAITIHEHEYLGEGRFRCVCSGGTYVRTLAHDLGEAIGCGAHLIQLQRTKVGAFTLEQAVDIESITREGLVPLADALAHHESVRLPVDVEGRIRQGQRVPIRPVPKVSPVVMLDARDEVIGMAEIALGSLQPICITPRG